MLETKRIEAWTVWCEASDNGDPEGFRAIVNIGPYAKEADAVAMAQRMKAVIEADIAEDSRQ